MDARDLRTNEEAMRWLLLKLAKDLELSARVAVSPVVAAAHAAAADAYRLHAAAIVCEAP
jgi:hypothetical protein